MFFMADPACFAENRFHYRFRTNNSAIPHLVKRMSVNQHLDEATSTRWGRTMRSTVTKPNRWWYLIGVAVIVLAFVGMAIYIDVRLPDTRFVAPGTYDVELASAGDYVVYYEHQSVVEGRTFKTSVDLPPISLTLVARDTGNAVELRQPQGTSEYTFGQRSVKAVFEFSIDEPGTYLFSAQYDRGVTGPDVVFAIGVEP